MRQNVRKFRCIFETAFSDESLPLSRFDAIKAELVCQRIRRFGRDVGFPSSESCFYRIVKKIAIKCKVLSQNVNVVKSFIRLFSSPNFTMA